jgi:hypothetical protein
MNKGRIPPNTLKNEIDPLSGDGLELDTEAGDESEGGDGHARVLDGIVQRVAKGAEVRVQQVEEGGDEQADHDLERSASLEKHDDCAQE